MRILKSISVILLLLIWSKSSILKAQVTFGSTIAPKSGVLLDLKQNDSDAANSTLGLLLPRVYVKYSNQLHPMLDELTDYPSNATVKTQQDQLHVGLLVYNLNQCLLGGGKDKGMVVWNGTQWASLSNSVSKAADVVGNLDQEGNMFYSRHFGDAGEWMLQNLSVKTYNDGTPIGTENTEWSSPSAQAPILAGLLYPKNIALRKTETELNTAYNEYTIVGLCPIDWRIPSDADWNNLEKEINTTTSLYADASDIGAWNTSWENATGVRGKFGEAMKAVCLLNYTYPTDGSPITNTDGLSFSPEQGGFNVLLTGYANNNQYGNEARYWTATVATAPQVYTRLFSKSVDGVYRNVSTSTEMSAIRCMKDAVFKCGGLLKDSEGNTYTTALFGNQCWMTQNLRVTQNSTGTSISNDNNTNNQEAEYYRLTSGAANTDGYLYTWKAATMNNEPSKTKMPDDNTNVPSDVQGICPEGWVVPSDYDWRVLEQTLAGAAWNTADDGKVGWVGEAGIVGTKMKSIGANDFNAKLVGSSLSGSISGIGSNANFWSSSAVFTQLGTSQNAPYRGVTSTDAGVYRDVASKAAMLSIRCVQK